MTSICLTSSVDKNNQIRVDVFCQRAPGPVFFLPPRQSIRLGRHRGELEPRRKLFRHSCYYRETEKGPWTNIVEAQQERRTVAFGLEELAISDPLQTCRKVWKRTVFSLVVATRESAYALRFSENRHTNLPRVVLFKNTILKTIRVTSPAQQIAMPSARLVFLDQKKSGFFRQRDQKK